jgi:hypothetical protein
MDPMNPIVFLDIDGVLNTGKEYHEWNSAHDEALKEKKEGYNDRWLSPAGDPFAELLFGREHVDALNQITWTRRWSSAPPGGCSTPPVSRTWSTC